MNVKVSGSVRVDLLGGTLDIFPINHILPKVVTLNVATSLMAIAELSDLEELAIKIHSKDYDQLETIPLSELNEENFQNQKFGPLNFVLQIIHLFLKDNQDKNHQFPNGKGLHVVLQSGSPPGAGLGGSSSLGVTLYKALFTKFFPQKKFDPIKAIRIVNIIEGKILNAGVPGYQDYYPAMFGGILALTPKLDEISVHQLYSLPLKKFLESHLTLVYSGNTRLSGINNWEVYKAFFNGDEKVRSGLFNIAKLSTRAFDVMKAGENFDELLSLLANEGEERKKLFPGILNTEMQNFYNDIHRDSSQGIIGMKVCGAGGGGCFIVIHKPQGLLRVLDLIKKHNMTQLQFEIVPPTHDGMFMSANSLHQEGELSCP